MSVYKVPETRAGGSLGAVSPHAPSFHIIDHIIYHTSLDVPELVPATGLERSTRAFAAALDRANGMTLAQPLAHDLATQVEKGRLTPDKASRLRGLITGSLLFVSQFSGGLGSGPALKVGGRDLTTNLPRPAPKFRAFDKRTGAVVWEKELPLAPAASPMTYMAGGKQYVVVAVSGRQYPGEFIALAIP